MRSFTANLATRVALPALLLAISGCVGFVEPTRSLDRAPTPAGARASAAAEASAGLFYPLDLGNHWTFHRNLSIEIDPIGGPPGPVSAIEQTMDVDLVGTATQLGREYVVQRETHHVGGGSLAVDYFRRQDRGGLYEADLTPRANDRRSETLRAAAVAMTGSIADGPTRAAVARLLEKQGIIRDLALHGRWPSGTLAGGARPGPLDSEIVLLRYPLHRQASWHLREDPLFVYVVEGQETLALPAGSFNAWRIRIESALFGPNDRVHAWYGRNGLLQLADHSEGIMTDGNGNPTAIVVGDDRFVVSELSLVGPRALTP